MSEFLFLFIYNNIVHISLSKEFKIKCCFNCVEPLIPQMPHIIKTWCMSLRPQALPIQPLSDPCLLRPPSQGSGKITLKAREGEGEGSTPKAFSDLYLELLLQKCSHLNATTEDTYVNESAAPR